MGGSSLRKRAHGLEPGNMDKEGFVDTGAHRETKRSDNWYRKMSEDPWRLKIAWEGSDDWYHWRLTIWPLRAPAPPCPQGRIWCPHWTVDGKVEREVETEKKLVAQVGEDRGTSEWHW